MDNKVSLFVATPMYGGMATGTYTAALMQTPMTLSANGILMYYAHMMNESLITRARNSLADDFLKSEATHLMFIDADIGFNPRDIVSMAQQDKDIVCGLYPKKEIHWTRVSQAVQQGVPPNELKDHTGTFVVNLVGESVHKPVKSNELVEIDNGGTGFMLIKRSVFEALADKVPSYTSDMYLATDTVREPKIIKEYFATSIDEATNRLFSEDYHFCKLARHNGFKIYAAPWVQLSHTGTYVFSGALQRV